MDPQHPHPALATGLLDLLAVPGLGQEMLGHLGRAVGNVRLVCRGLRVQVCVPSLHGCTWLNFAAPAQVDSQIEWLLITDNNKAVQADCDQRSSTSAGLRMVSLAPQS
jgi:hypothetical protein